MSQKVHMDRFKWVENTSQFNEDFIKSYNEEKDYEYFLAADLQYPKKSYMIFTMIYPF